MGNEDFKSLEDVIKWLNDQSEIKDGEVKAAFEKYDGIMDDVGAKINVLYDEKLIGAQRDLYDSFSAEMKGLDNMSDGVNTKITGAHRRDMHQAMVNALKKYFKKAGKENGEAILNVVDGETDVEQQYKFLAKAYDDHMMLDPKKGMSSMIHQMMGDGEKKLADVLKHLDNSTSIHAQNYGMRLKGQAAQKLLGALNAQEAAAHVYGEIHGEGEGQFKIKSQQNWMAKDLTEVLEARHAYKTGELPEGANWEKYSIEYSGGD